MIPVSTAATANGEPLAKPTGTRLDVLDGHTPTARRAGRSRAQASTSRRHHESTHLNPKHTSPSHVQANTSTAAP
ncbi:hypothetical protein GCM10010109_75530 [Actinoplanes campanulatus]|nr:hypothetical protein GCM10010109_75530 [Actinoplanes campanulatus]GID42325.1 hypothetical protein Aca09nite_88310 [Actinoplanes campanulatus]